MIKGERTDPIAPTGSTCPILGPLLQLSPNRPHDRNRCLCGLCPNLSELSACRRAVRTLSPHRTEHRPLRQFRDRFSIECRSCWNSTWASLYRQSRRGLSNLCVFTRILTAFVQVFEESEATIKRGNQSHDRFPGLGRHGLHPHRLRRFVKIRRQVIAPRHFRPSLIFAEKSFVTSGTTRRPLAPIKWTYSSPAKRINAYLVHLLRCTCKCLLAY